MPGLSPEERAVFEAVSTRDVIDVAQPFIPPAPKPAVFKAVLRLCAGISHRLTGRWRALMQDDSCGSGAGGAAGMNAFREMLCREPDATFEDDALREAEAAVFSTMIDAGWTARPWVSVAWRTHYLRWILMLAEAVRRRLASARPVALMFVPADLGDQLRAAALLDLAERCNDVWRVCAAELELARG